MRFAYSSRIVLPSPGATPAHVPSSNALPAAPPASSTSGAPDGGLAGRAARVGAGRGAGEPRAGRAWQAAGEPLRHLVHELVLLAAPVVVRVDDVVERLLRVEAGDQAGRGLVPEVEAEFAG